ncbi:MAG: Hsp20/alpha crystallin family protein [Crocinitomicaceae bacterium]|nr:Hsp20/alpha crystallin family protein [Crocinitomicaceae bacterium]
MNITKHNRPRTFSNDFDKFFNDFFFTPVRANQKNHFENVPAVNISEKDGTFHIELAVPGMKKEDFKIEIHDGVMSISSEMKEETTSEEKNYSRREFNYSSFERRFTLPENVEDDKVSARYEDGILKIDVPKADETVKNTKKQIAIS